MTAWRRTVERFSAWASVPAPERFTYRSYLRYLGRALPRYGIGPSLVVGYQVVAHGLDRAVFFAGWIAAAVTASVAGFAVVRRDWGYATAATGAVVAAGVGLCAWLPTVGLAGWLVAFVAWFAAMAGLAGAAAAAR